MKTKQLIFFKCATIAGNIIFILWGSFNAINEGFSGTLPEKFSYLGLVSLLAMNSFLLISGSKQHQFTKQKAS